MTKLQIWQTIILDLKRASKFLVLGNTSRTEYFLKEAGQLWRDNFEKVELPAWVKQYVHFEVNGEDKIMAAERLLLAANLLTGRARVANL